MKVALWVMLILIPVVLCAASTLGQQPDVLPESNSREPGPVRKPHLAQEIQPDEREKADLHQRLGRSSARTMDVEEIQRLTESNPDSALKLIRRLMKPSYNKFLLLALAYERIGRLEEAVEAYREAFAIINSDGYARLRMAFNLIKIASKKEASTPGSGRMELQEGLEEILRALTILGMQEGMVGTEPQLRLTFEKLWEGIPALHRYVHQIWPVLAAILETGLRLGIEEESIRQWYAFYRDTIILQPRYEALMASYVFWESKKHEGADSQRSLDLKSKAARLADQAGFPEATAKVFISAARLCTSEGWFEESLYYARLAYKYSASTGYAREFAAATTALAAQESNAENPNWDKVVSLYQEVIDLPELPVREKAEAWEGIAWALLAKGGNISEAIRAAETAYRLDPSRHAVVEEALLRSEYHMYRSKMLQREGNPDRGEDTQAAAATPVTPNAHTERDPLSQVLAFRTRVLEAAVATVFEERKDPRVIEDLLQFIWDNCKDLRELDAATKSNATMRYLAKALFEYGVALSFAAKIDSASAVLKSIEKRVPGFTQLKLRDKTYSARDLREHHNKFTRSLKPVRFVATIPEEKWPAFEGIHIAIVGDKMHDIRTANYLREVERALRDTLSSRGTATIRLPNPLRYKITGPGMRDIHFQAEKGRPVFIRDEGVSVRLIFSPPDIVTPSEDLVVRELDTGKEVTLSDLITGVPYELRLTAKLPSEYTFPREQKVIFLTKGEERWKEHLSWPDDVRVKTVDERGGATLRLRKLSGPERWGKFLILPVIGLLAQLAL